MRSYNQGEFLNNFKFYDLFNTILKSWGDHHGKDVGKNKCPDAGVIDRLLYVYWQVKEPALDLPGFELANSLENYIIWLRSPYNEDAPGRWPKQGQVRYNYYILIIALGKYYGWIS